MAVVENAIAIVPTGSESQIDSDFHGDPRFRVYKPTQKMNTIGQAMSQCYAEPRNSGLPFSLILCSMNFPSMRHQKRIQ